MSAFKVVRDAQGRCRGCGPNDDGYEPTIPAGGALELSDVFVAVDPTPEEAATAARGAADEQERADCKLDSAIMSLVNQTRAEWNAWAGTNFPTLTAPERARLGALFWVVSIGVRQRVRNGG